MSTPTHSAHDGLDIQVAALSTKIIGIEQGMSSIRTDIASLVSAFNARSTTNWPVIIGFIGVMVTGAGVLVAVFGSIGGLVWSQLNRDQGKVVSTLDKLDSKFMPKDDIEKSLEVRTRFREFEGHDPPVHPHRRFGPGVARARRRPRPARNHDEDTAQAITYTLWGWYRNEPRVEVDCDPSLFWWYRHGKTFLGSTHGHAAKPSAMPQVMAVRRARDWGASQHRFVHTFHVHHQSKFVSDEGGVIVETHRPRARRTRGISDRGSCRADP